MMMIYPRMLGSQPASVGLARREWADRINHQTVAAGALPPVYLFPFFTSVLWLAELWCLCPGEGEMTACLCFLFFVEWTVTLTWKVTYLYQIKYNLIESAIKTFEYNSRHNKIQHVRSKPRQLVYFNFQLDIIWHMQLQIRASSRLHQTASDCIRLHQTASDQHASGDCKVLWVYLFR